MKQVITFILLLTFSATLFCQETIPSNPITKADWQLKSKSQKTGAWVLLCGGVSSMLVGKLLVNDVNADLSDQMFGIMIEGAGILSMLGSIPLFVAASRNNKKASTISAYLNMQNTGEARGYRLTHIYYPALSFRVNLR